MPLGIGAAIGLGVGGSVLNGILGRRSANKASRAYTDALQANQGHYDAFDGAIQNFLERTNRRYSGQQNQYATLGDNAYQNLMNIQQGNLGAIPGYNFGLNEGTRAINRMNATRGLHGSTAHGQALNNYAQNYANTQFNQHFNRNFGLFNRSQQAQDNILARLQGADAQSLYMRNSLLNARVGNNTAIGQQTADNFINQQSALDQALGNSLGFLSLGATQRRQPTAPSPTGLNIPAFNINSTYDPANGGINYPFGRGI